MAFHSLQRAALACALAVTTLIAPTCAQTGTLTVQVDKPGVAISPILYGLMTEEVNHSYDGGLYGELLQNRSFQDDPQAPAHWTLTQSGGAVGSLALDSSQPVSAALPVSLRLQIMSAGQGGRVGVANDGYWGVAVTPNTSYRASFYAKGSDGFAGPLVVEIKSADGTTVYARAQVSQITGQWQRCAVTLQTGSVVPTSDARFVVSAARPGTVWLSLVSLFPPTFNNRPNGNRIDLMQKMADMKPAFLRLPGGNYLEGDTIATRFDWKKTLGPLDERPGHHGPWGYRSTDGMGLLEMLEWCEDLHMQPVLAVFAGYALRHEHVVGPELQPFVQDALDEIEYVTGSTQTPWGKRRAADRHPAPFPLTYVEIGNEDWFDRSGSYEGRFAQFYDALKAKYPTLKLIATAPVRTRTPDVIDEHFYRSPQQMEHDAQHYDTYSRTGPKIFVGEWASQEGKPTPTLNAALGDAAWLTGLERNSDVVVMEAYAPLLINVNPGAAQWGTNLIGYDALHSFGSPSYYVQSLFAKNTGNVVLPTQVTLNAPSMPTLSVPRGKIGVGTWRTQAEFKDITVTQGGKTLYEKKDFASGMADWTPGQGQWAAVDGVLRQSAEGTDCRAVAGDAGWQDYTYTLKARKLSGAEGFLVLFHVQDSAHFVWWNIGGWGNTRTALQRADGGDAQEFGPSVPVTVETGHWYDIRIECQGRAIRCFLDGNLVTEATDTPVSAGSPIVAAASRVTATGDVFVKVVNVSAVPQSLRMNVQGARHVGKTAIMQVLSGEPGDVNTVNAPRKVVPKISVLAGIGPAFLHTFPAYSVTVLRLRAQ